MPISLLPTLLMAILVVGYTPGPANIYALSMSIRHGKRRVLNMWLGLLVGFSTAIFILALLTHLLGTVLGPYIGYVKYLGAAYIMWLGWKIYHTSGQTKKDNRDCTFWSGFIVQMTNAKILLFDLTCFSSFVLPYSNRLFDLLVVSTMLLIAGPGANLVYVYIGTYLNHFFSKYRRQSDIVMSLALALCAIYIVLN
jgi:cysteine/O-acetylserine efflux protein